MNQLKCNIPGKEYPIYIGKNLEKEAEDFRNSLLEYDRIVLVADETAHRFHGDSASRLLGESHGLITVPSGEQHKTLETVKMLYSSFLENNMTRSSLIIVMGGGVTGDLAGFAAATYMRGIDFAMIPTTLLAQVDSSVGGKVAVNLPEGKNLVGAFHQPRAVFIDLAYLDTLPDSEFLQGLAETLKHGVISDPALFDFMADNAEAILFRNEEPLTRIIKDALNIKICHVENDELDKSGRIKLNFGHTFAHAYEQIYEYLSVRHGESVAAGMVAAARLGRKLGTCDQAYVDRLIEVLEKFNLPTHFPKARSESILGALSRDKKHKAGAFTFVLPVRIGEVKIVNDVSKEAVLDVLDEISA